MGGWVWGIRSWMFLLSKSYTWKSYNYCEMYGFLWSWMFGFIFGRNQNIVQTCKSIQIIQQCVGKLRILIISKKKFPVLRNAFAQKNRVIWDPTKNKAGAMIFGLVAIFVPRRNGVAEGGYWIILRPSVSPSVRAFALNTRCISSLFGKMDRLFQLPFKILNVPIKSLPCSITREFLKPFFRKFIHPHSHRIKLISW